MILSFIELLNYQHQLSMVDGSFDPLHPGHILYFESAKKIGYPLLVNITPDSYTVKKHPIFIPSEQRAVILDALKTINFVHISEVTTAEVLAQLKPKYYIKGTDWEGRLPEVETNICKENNIEIKYLDTILNSSSNILKQYLLQTKSQN